MVSAVDIDELDRDAQSIGRLAHTSLQQGVDTEASTQVWLQLLGHPVRRHLGVIVMAGCDDGPRKAQ